MGRLDWSPSIGGSSSDEVDVEAPYGTRDGAGSTSLGTPRASRICLGWTVNCLGDGRQAP